MSHRTGQFGAYLTFPAYWAEGFCLMVGDAYKELAKHREASLAAIMGETPPERFAIVDPQVITKEMQDQQGETDDSPETSPLHEGLMRGAIAHLEPDYKGSRRTLAWKLTLFLKDPADCQVGEKCMVTPERVLRDDNLITEDGRPDQNFKHLGGYISDPGMVVLLRVR